MFHRSHPVQPPRDERAIVLGAVHVEPPPLGSWDGVRGSFLRAGAPMDYTLCGTEDRLVELVLAGQVDVAWLSPLGFARARQREPSMARILTLASEVGQRSVLVVRSGSTLGLTSLAGCRLAVGSADCGRARLFPLFFLRSVGVAVGDVMLVPFDVDPGKAGDTGGSERAVLNAVMDGLVDAGLVGEAAFLAAKPPSLTAVWFTPRFDGASFAALASLPTTLRGTFIRVLTQKSDNGSRVSTWTVPEEAGYHLVAGAVAGDFGG